jgi:hypothetical protein
MHESPVWGSHQCNGESAAVVGPAELSIPWTGPGTGLPFAHGQSYPSLHGAPVHGGVVHGGAFHPNAGGARICPNGFNTRSWPGEGLSYAPVNTLNATGVTLAPPNHQVTSAMAVNTIGDMVTAPPASGAHMAVLNPIEFSAPQMSRTRTGRRGPKRGLLGRVFEPNLQKVQRRLRQERADAGAIECLGSEIFLDGTITREAFKVPMTLDQRRARDGTQKYMLVVEIVPHSHRGVDYRCLLCPAQARAEFKNREDTLRHLYKDHFGLSVDCEHW